MKPSWCFSDATTHAEQYSKFFMVLALVILSLVTKLDCICNFSSQFVNDDMSMQANISELDHLIIY